jgi:hypothetical protein
MELALSPSLSLALDVLGRYASAGGFGGTAESSSGPTKTGGKLYYMDVTVPGLGVFPFINYENSLPADISLSNVREAKLDLSGFSARLGFIFHF